MVARSCGATSVHSVSNLLSSDMLFTACRYLARKSHVSSGCTTGCISSLNKNRTKGFKPLSGTVPANPTHSDAQA